MRMPSRKKSLRHQILFSLVVDHLQQLNKDGIPLEEDLQTKGGMHGERQIVVSHLRLNSPTSFLLLSCVRCNLYTLLIAFYSHIGIDE
jgi:hypothetical protein